MTKPPLQTTTKMRKAALVVLLLVLSVSVSVGLVACSAGNSDTVVTGTLDGSAGDIDASTPPPSTPPPGPQTEPAKNAGFTCEVKRLLTVKCQTCHSDPPQGGAVVPMMTVRQMLAWSVTDPTKTVAEVALERMQNAASPMPPASFNNAATPDEIQAFEAWIQGNFVGFCQGAVPPNATCTTCHGDATRVGAAGTDPQISIAPPRGSNGEMLPSQAAVGAHEAHLGVSPRTGTDFTAAPLQCNDCHILPTSTSHSNGIIDMSWGPLAKAGGASPDYNGATCTNVYCHGAFTGGRNTFAPAWTGGKMNCGSCHGTPPPTPPHTNPAAECSTCHGAGYSQTAQTVNKAKHINGVVDVDYAGATCTSCHGDITRVGIAGSDPQVKSSPPVGSKGETATPPSRAVGVHAAHVNQNDLAANPLQCVDCHVVPTSTSHSNGVVDMVFGALAKTAGATPAWNGTTCANVYCHGAFTGGTTTAAPAWAVAPTPGGIACGSCHALPPVDPVNHPNPALECSGCHGAGYSQTAKTVNKTLHLNGTIDTSTTAQTCQSCHGDDTRVAIAGADLQLKSAPPLGSKGETLTSQAAVGAHIAHLNKGTFSAPIACNECHVVPIVTAPSGTHRNGTDDVVFGALAKTGGAVPVWNGTTCASSYCHGKFTGGAAATPNWTASGTLACNACHGLPPATPAHSNPALACSTCHGPGYSTTTVDKTLHINGVVDVNTAAMTCGSCHGDNTRVAISGADPALKASPPLGTKGETLTSTRAVGMHQGHLNTGTFTSPTACAECHVVPITNSHSNGTVDMAFGTLAKTGGATPVWNGTTCASTYCHGNYPGGKVAAPSWTSGTVTCTNSCHGTATSPAPATPAHSNTTLACSVCHGAGYSSSAVNKPTHINGVVDVNQSALTCTTCHGDATRVGIAGSDAKQTSAPPVGVGGETAATSLAVGAHQAHLNKTDLTAAPMPCNSCHAVPSNTLHSDGVIQVTFGALAKTGGVVPSWNGTGCAATYCHGNFPNGATTAVPGWTGAPMTCTSCHGAPPSTQDHRRGDHQVPCGDCHGAGYTSTVLVKSLHINGVKDVAGPKIKTWNSSTKSCTPTCHGTQRWQ
jgi:predicted CxxxxCH...CXXCH cytochrome family protein